MQKENIQKALEALKVKISKQFGPQSQLYLFGSVARGEYASGSDIDIMVILPCKLSNAIEEQVFELAYDIELQYDVVFGIVVYSLDFWLSPVAEYIPLFLPRSARANKALETDDPTGHGSAPHYAQIINMEGK
jgi:predicted nucleotidyltransferase